jgi:hypothetical protein
MVLFKSMSIQKHAKGGWKGMTTATPAVEGCVFSNLEDEKGLLLFS